MSILASYIYILGYLLKHLLSKANLLVLLFLFLKVLLLYFLSLLGLFKALKYLLPIILTILQFRFLLPKSAFILLTPIYIFNRVLLFTHPLITTRTPPNYYTYTPYLIWFRHSLIKSDNASLS